jgi:hypothetical protein
MTDRGVTVAGPKVDALGRTARIVGMAVIGVVALILLTIYVFIPASIAIIGALMHG